MGWGGGGSVELLWSRGTPFLSEADETLTHTLSTSSKVELDTKQLPCFLRAAARGQEVVNAAASTSKADHEMSQIKNSKFHRH